MSTSNSTGSLSWRGIITPGGLSPQLHPAEDDGGFGNTLERTIRASIHKHLEDVHSLDVSAAEHDAILQREIERLMNAVKGEIEAHATIIATTAKERQDLAKGVRNKLSGYADRAAELEYRQRGQNFDSA